MSHVFMSKRLKIGILIVLGAAVGIVVAGNWMLGHADRYLPRATAYLTKRTGLNVNIRHATASLLPMTVTLYDVTVANPKPFPAGNFLSIPEAKGVVEFVPLLHGKLAVHSLVLEKPAFNFISDPDGKWNFQNPAGKAQSNQPMHLSMGPISRLRIEHGELLGSALVDPADTPGPVVFEAHNFSGEIDQIDFKGLKNEQKDAQGSLTADEVRFGKVRVKALHSDIRIAPRQLAFQRFHAKTYRGEASGDFTFTFGRSTTKFNTDLAVNGIGVNYLLAEFETGPAALTGMMQARLNITGVVTHAAHPFKNIEGTGKFDIRHGDFPQADKGKRMADVDRLRDPSAAAMPPAAFSTFAGDMEMKNDRIYSRSIGIDFYGVDLDGSGNVAERTGSLDYSGTATIHHKQGFFTNMYARLFKGGEEKHGHLVFPFRLTGTVSNPVCHIVK